MRPAMSDQRPEVGDRSAVKTQLTSVLLECPLIVLTSGCTGTAVGSRDPIGVSRPAVGLAGRRDPDRSILEIYC
jgi:hypothetical protein